MYTFLGAFIAYVVGSLPSIPDTLNIIDKCTSKEVFKANEVVKVSVYKDFLKFWWSLFFDIFKIAAFVYILVLQQYLVFLAFVAGLYFPIWNRFRSRDIVIFPLILLFYLNFLLGIICSGFYYFIYKKNPILKDLVLLASVFIVSLVLWVLNMDIILVYFCLTIAGFSILRLFFSFRLSPSGRKI